MYANVGLINAEGIGDAPSDPKELLTGLFGHSNQIKSYIFLVEATP